MHDQDITFEKNIQPARRPGKEDMVTCPTCGLRVSNTTSTCPQDGTPIQPDPAGLNEAYEFLGAVGVGGMSVIYKAKQRTLDRYVAIKMLHGHLAGDDTVLRFRQEAKAASTLNHPNIVSVHDFGVSEHGQPYMIMDFVEGRNLAEVLKSIGAIPIAQCLDIFIEVCDALVHAHAHGILHRDLKPSNIILTTTSEHASTVRIVDFGIAKILGSHESSAQNLTQSGDLFGSPLYMSPEQCAGKKVDRRADIYSFGCLMYECLTGRVPLRGPTAVDTIMKQMNENPLLISQLRPDKDYPPRLEDVVDKMLEKNPDKRYQTMEELKKDLLSIQREVDSGEWSESKQRLRRTFRGHLPKIAIAAMSLVVLTGAVAFFLSAREPEEVSQSNGQPAYNSQSPVLNTHSELLTLVPRDRITDQVLSECLPVNSGMSKLDLSGAKHVDDYGLVFVAKQTQLRSLALDDSAISDNGLRRLQSLHQLTDLAVRNTAITDTGLEYLSAFPNLTGLSLSATRISNNGLKFLKPLKGLSYLSLNKTAITGANLEELQTLPLEKLHLSSLRLSVADLKKLSAFTGLQILSLDDDNFSNDAIVQLAPLRSLRSLSMNSTLTTDQVAVYVVKYLPQLAHLSLQYSQLGDVGARTISQLNSLESLDLSYSRISDEGLQSLARLPKLAELSLVHCHITDAGLRTIASMHQLQKLSLGANACTDKGLHALKSLPNLHSLQIGNAGISRHAVSEFGKAKPGCEVEFYDYDQ